MLYSYIFLTTLDDTLNYNTMHHFLVPMTERIPNHPDELLASLSEALEGSDYACLTIATESGTALLLKAPRIEIESVRGRVPIQLGHELYDHPNAPVIRMALRIYDRPTAPLAMETFINVADDAQRADYAVLAEQDEIALLFIDEWHQQRLAKRISHNARELVPQVLAAAELLLGQIAPDQFDFERAKQAIMEGTQL